MELTTFGAMLRFAIELEAGLQSLYARWQQSQIDPRLAAALAEASSQARRNLLSLERIRREQVNEMLLESVEGIESSDYTLEEADRPASGAALQEAEALAERFYRNAGRTISIPEVARSLHRLAELHARRKDTDPQSM